MRFTRFLLTITIGAAALTFSPAPLRAAESEADKTARQAGEAAKAKDWNKAVEGFKRAAEMDRKHANGYAAALQHRGAEFINQKKFPEAIGDFSEALKISPNDADTHERRAYAEIQMKEFDKALQDYSDSIKADPKEARVYLLRSYLFELKGDVKAGVADCDTVLKLDPGNAEAAGRKGRLEARVRAQAQAPQATPSGPIRNPKVPAPGPAGASNIPPTSSATPSPLQKRKPD